MFKLLLCTQLSLILVVSGFAQQTPIDSKPQTDQAKLDRYKKKAKNQKITGWTMLGGGALLIAIGVLVSNGNSDEYYQYDQNGNIIEDESTPASGYFAAAGVLSMVGSIPFFISSGVNKRKARAFVGTTYYPNPISPARQKIMPSAGIQFSIH